MFRYLSGPARGTFCPNVALWPLGSLPRNESVTKRVDPKRKQSIWTTIPNYVRSIMLFQFFLILVMSGWLYLEYTHNVYLQSYVKNYLQANPAILQAGIPGVLAGISGALYAKLRRTNKELAIIESRRMVLPRTTDNLASILKALPEIEVGPSLTERVFADTQFRRPQGKYHGLNRVSEIQKLPYIDEDADGS